jgi:hypothetical protein
VEDQNKGQNVRKDEDVEAHMHKNAPHKGAPHKGREDDGDDVEAHMHKNAPHKGMHKA